jgi:coenzyme F420-dependent glucose-6-phosphate dehydrogenase
MTSLAWMCALDARQPEELLEEAALADQLGFDGILVPDPFNPWTDDGSAGFVWSWLGAACERTSRAWLMSVVTSPNTRYHPAVVAQAAATVSRLSDGRFRLGVGLGDPIHYLPIGVRRQRYAQQVRTFTEAVELVRALLIGDEVTGGEAFPVDHARLYSPPTSPLPIYVAASGPRSAAVAARIGDGLILSVRDPETSFAQVVEPFRSTAVANGRAGLPVLATRWCILAESDAEAVTALGPLRGLRVPGRGESPDPSVHRRTADGMPTEELLSSWLVARDADDLVDAYSPLINVLGADAVGICVASLDPLTTLRLVASDVAPRLR